jgi:hypothetical protein
MTISFCGVIETGEQNHLPTHTHEIRPFVAKWLARTGQRCNKIGKVT